jgi:hypothetical protein
VNPADAALILQQESVLLTLADQEEADGDTTEEDRGRLA